MRFRDPFDLAARSRPVAPEREQSADFRDRKAKAARAPDEPQLVDVALAIVAVGVVPALGRTQKADRLVMADHLGVDAARRRRFADLHGLEPA